ncbi:hypothetical protein [Cesiribacter andamanensis]|uniref:Uncharacterized protein n=1 Tax=Cesiribacter andamanensis AMV16 TaxID=1279009 RepID=M7NSI5_9BACT|nr:hypothetical protein [Cesiribacter andamanensis]EMR01444.1 hypothetical protein ADICEAN_03430 [Cesiribacter andamanensis AMV16]
MAVRTPFFAASLLLLLAGSTACENTERKVQAPVAIGAEEADPEAAAVRLQVRAGADTTITSDQLMQRLMPELTVEGVLSRMPEAEVTRRQPQPNRHIPGQIDTLVTVKSDSSLFEFYSLAIKDMLQSATLRKPGVAMGSGLEVGMTTDEVARRIPDLQQLRDMPQSLIIRAEQTPVSLRLRFRHNRLEYMQYEGYVD